MQSVDNSRSSGEYLLSSLLGVCAYYTLLKNRMEVYALIKKDTLNKHVRLLTRLYGITVAMYHRILASQ